MIREENDFRISVAGAQEKTALLRIGNDWCIPKGITPTTHIIKLPIGEIRQPNATLDLSQSVDNEYSVFIQAGGSYRLTPFYDIISAFPVLGGTGIHISDLKLAMGLNASKGKKRQSIKFIRDIFWRQQRC